MRRGAVDFLEKPFQREQFMTVLARLQRLRQPSQRIVQLEQGSDRDPERKTWNKSLISPRRRHARMPWTMLLRGGQDAGLGADSG